MTRDYPKKTKSSQDINIVKKSFVNRTKDIQKDFELCSSFSPSGDQPNAIKELEKGILEGKKNQVLLGVTGSGKTFTMANLIKKCGKTTLIMAPNKTLVPVIWRDA